jgi:hypothetical protein
MVMLLLHNVVNRSIELVQFYRESTLFMSQEWMKELKRWTAQS